MKETEYVYAVARIRANELFLLGETSLNSLISSSNIVDAKSILSQNGYDFTKGINSALSLRMQDAWSLICEVLPLKNALDFLIVKNDFHNLKAALKCLFNNESAEKYMLSPCINDKKEILNIVAERSFDLLPVYMIEAAKTAYDVLVRTMNGQLCEVILDSAALSAEIMLSKNADALELYALCEKKALFANIKTAYRGAKVKKNSDFYEKAICECSLIDKKALSNAAVTGVDSVLEYLKQNSFSELAGVLEVSSVEFEKYCDNEIMTMIEEYKMTAFGILPLAGYYLALEAEVLNVRMILSAFHSGISKNTISERLRRLYV